MWEESRELQLQSNSRLRRYRRDCVQRRPNLCKGREREMRMGMERKEDKANESLKCKHVKKEN